jgi:3-oxoacyl-[acyl-carrier protein] reductase
MTYQKQLHGKICIITGSGRGIGRAIAERFSHEGAIVYANALESEQIDAWASDISQKDNTSVIPLYFDITDANAAKNAILKVKKEQGRIDVLVNNAGLGYNELIGMISIDKMREIFEVNVYALTNLLQLSARIMSRQQSGSIINISSTVGMKGNPGQLAYAASKGAVIAITKSAAKELASQKIRVNSIAPGLVDTEMFRLAESKNMEERISKIGMGRLAEPNEIAHLCVFLASDYSEYLTGQIIAVDGSALL